MADGTRLITTELAASLCECIEADHGHLPLELLLNKNDPQEQPVIGNTERDDLRRARLLGVLGPQTKG